MEHDSFIELISSFSVSEPIRKRDDIWLELPSGEIVNFKIRLSEKGLVEKVIDENKNEFLPEFWIAERLGRLSVLARSISSSLGNDTVFVAPEVNYDIRWAVSDEPEEGIDSACNILKKVIDTPDMWESHIVYLTSNAGEGKTTVLEKIAFDYAENYTPGKGKLIVPITLSGKPFIRFDDLIVGTLANRFKFTGLFYSSFISLIRMNIIIPAFDGFEEMFVESPSGAAMSAMIEFIKEVKGKGTVLVAARAAYYEYQNLTTQSKLYDAIASYPVAFSKIKIERWNKSQFINFGIQKGFKNEEALRLYSSVSQIFGKTHPVLTRAVLVNKLYTLFEESQDINDFLSTAPTDYNEFYQKFVYTIIEREAKKWLMKKTTGSMPVLTLEQHKKLLCMIAREMWSARSEVLSKDMIDMITDLFIDSENLGADEAWQIKTRIKDHAILRMADSNKSYFEFDHEDFYHFFLGEMLSNLIINDYNDFFDIIRKNRLPKEALDSCVHALQKEIPQGLLLSLHERNKQELRSSYARENASLLMLMMNEMLKEHIDILGIVFETEPLNNIKISNVCFKECIFSSLKISKIGADVRFSNCNIMEIEADSNSVSNVQIIGNTVINSLHNILEDHIEYSPRIINSILQGEFGFVFELQGESTFNKSITQQSDDRLLLFEKVLRIFFRRIEINSDIVNLKLGSTKNKIFWNDIYPNIKNIILDEVQYRGGGNQKRIRIICHMGKIQKALENADGSFDKFLTIIKSFKK